MQKKLLTGLFWVLLLNLLIKPFWILGIEVGVQNAVDVAEYGFYFAIFNMAYIFNILLDMGITNFNTRNIAQHPKLIDKHLSGILSIKVMLLGLYLVVTFTVGWLQGYSSRQFYLLALLSFNQFLNSLILYLRSNFEGLLLFGWDSLISILDRLLMIVICGALLWWPGHPTFRIEWFVYAQTVAYLLTAFTALVVLLRKVRWHRLRFSWPFTLAIMKQSLPFALLVLLMASYNRIDPILLSNLAPEGKGAYLSGIYAGAYRLLDALTMIAYLVSVPLLPIYARLTKPQNKKVSTLDTNDSQSNADSRTAPYSKELSSTTWWVTSLMWLFSVTAAVVCSSLAGQLMQLFYHEHAEEYAAVFGILIYGIIPISMTYVYGTLLTAAGRMKQLNLLAAIALAINVGINLIAIPRYGVVGSAYASLVAQSFMAVTQIGVALCFFNMRPNRGYILKMVVCTLLIIIFSLLTPQMVWWLKALLAMAIAVAAALALGLIKVREIVATLQEHE
ncbi:MAG: oligosaccharide flippase family protein [Bacteroidales bacterium]|nr:oligosaccharide flippase family protein [Bacteroidales bacterium]